MKFHPKYSSYIPLLLKALSEVPGDVLEMGTGPVSTPLLHWVCLEYKRLLVSYENSPRFFGMAKHSEGPFHHVLFVNEWDEADIEKEWGVALIDHAPAERRHIDIRRIATLAKAIVIHDSQGRANHHYHYSEIYSLFKYRGVWAKARPYTTALSNFVDVSKWTNAR